MIWRSTSHIVNTHQLLAIIIIIIITPGSLSLLPFFYHLAKFFNFVTWTVISVKPRLTTYFLPWQISVSCNHSSSFSFPSRFGGLSIYLTSCLHMRQFCSVRDSPVLRGSKVIHSYRGWVENPSPNPQANPTLRCPYLRPCSHSHLVLVWQHEQFCIHTY